MPPAALPCRPLPNPPPGPAPRPFPRPSPAGSRLLSSPEGAKANSFLIPDRTLLRFQFAQSRCHQPRFLVGLFPIHHLGQRLGRFLVPLLLVRASFQAPKGRKPIAFSSQIGRCCAFNSRNRDATSRASLSASSQSTTWASASAVSSSLSCWFAPPFKPRRGESQ